MAVQSRMREILAFNNIDYPIKVRNIYSLAQNMRSYEYKIFVHKKDYEEACYLIKDVFK